MVSSTTSQPLSVPGSGAMFDGIAHRYDLLNRLLSLGIDRGWRRRAVRALDLVPGREVLDLAVLDLAVLDLATGTADMVLEILRQQPRAKVVGLDPAPKMLAIGRAKLARRGLEDRAELCEGDAQDLPFPDARFDGVSIAFGIRNVPDRARALREMARVVRPGGRVVVLELCEPRRGPFAWAARLHLRWLVPRLGALLSGASEYRYLERSIAAFPPPETFAELMASCGLEVLEVTPMTFGTVCLFVATPRGGAR